MKKKEVQRFGVTLAVLCLFSVMACDTEQKEMGLEIISRRILEEVPSASGVELVNDVVYMVGDNSPWVYKLNRQYEVGDRLQVFSTEGLEDGIIPKADKPDFEAMTIADFGSDKELLLFGSGSKSPQRDSLVIIGIKGGEDDIVTYSLQDFYQKLKQVSQLSDEDLNVEGAAVIGNELFIFNRGKNVLLKYDLEAFFRHVIVHQPCPDPEVYRLKLPAIKGIEAGFSGAAVVPGQRKLLFTASVENTENWIADGEILGSFVGLIDLEKLQNDYAPKCMQILENDQPLNIKVESVTVVKAGNGGEIDIILVTDSDGGHSELLEATLK